MPFSPQSNRRFAGIRNQTPRADDGREARRRSKSESVETGFCERHAINARCRIAMQSATYRRESRGRADAMSRHAGERKSSLAAHPTKAFRPGMLEP
jgi:hypothetical protein